MMVIELTRILKLYRLNDVNLLCSIKMSCTPTKKSEKKPRWKIIQELETDLKILKRRRREVSAIVISILQVAMELVDKGVNPPLLIARAIRKKGAHSYSMVHKVFIELARYSPQLIKPYNEFKDGKIGYMTRAFYDVITHDINNWNELSELGEINESERADIQKLSELVDKLNRSANKIIWV